MRELWCIVFKGLVQGVGFRWTIQEHAEALGILGSVQNLQNGSVEVKLQTSQAHVEEFIHRVRLEPGFAKIESVEFKQLPESKPLSCFQILH